MQEFSAFSPHYGADQPRHLFFRQMCGGFRFRIDEIRHRFRLRKIHAPVEKRAFCEFPRFREARSCGENGVQQTFRGKSAAVALQFNGGLAGVAPRSFHIDCEAGFAGSAVRLRTGFAEMHDACRFR